MKMKKIAIIILASILTALAVVGGVIGIVTNVHKQAVITFVTNGGKEIPSVTLKKGEEYLLPKAEKEGKAFYAWYYDEEFVKICPETITASKDETLYARYGYEMFFDCAGGTEIRSRVYYDGEETGTLPVTYKDGFSFGGWYYDTAFNDVVGKKDVLASNTTVHAKFLKTTDTLMKMTSVKNVSSLPSVEVKTDGIVLHNGNVSDYISITSSNGEEIGVVCRSGGGDSYVVEPNKKLSDGATYSIKSLSSSAKFISVDGKDTENADEVTVTTHKEEKEVITKKASVHLTTKELAKVEENVYVYMDNGCEKPVTRIVARTKKEINAGSIVTIGESSSEKDDDYVCKVISAKKEKMQYVVGAEVTEAEFVVMEVVAPNVDDVYLDVEVYGERQAVLEGNVQLSEQTLIENLEKNEGLALLKNAVKNAIAESPTVLSYAESLSSEREKEQFLKAVAGVEFKTPKVKIDIKGTVLAFEIEISGEVQVKNFKVSVGLTVRNETSLDYRFTICKSRLVTLNPLLWFYTDIKVDLANDFSLALSATVEFADSDDDIHGIVDITDEVEYVIDVSKDGQNKFAEAITGSPLWDDEENLSYVDIFNIPLGQIPLPVPIVSLQIDFNVVGSLGARAGLYVEFSHHYVETTSLCNGETANGPKGKPVMYDSFRFTRATTANEINIAITLKGQVGFRCGLEVKLSLSIARLNSVAAVYVSFRFGPYIELSGLVSFRYTYDAVNKESKTHLYGGMYLEVGLFVNAKLGAKFLVYDVNTDIFDKKIGLYGVGDRLIPLEFVEKANTPENPFVITSRYGGVRMSLSEMMYLDIVTGEKVVDNASRNRYGKTLDYEFEFYDAPDYQTKDYKDFVEINGRSTLISRRYPFKTLRFAVKAKLVPSHGVYASGIEKIFYVEYRNPDGRDMATQNSEFRNEYYAGGGSTHSEVLSYLTFREGETVVPPEFTAETLPVRQGYYLDMNDLWEKYYPFLGDKVDENFDGTFPTITLENATEIHDYRIVNTCFYRLKWKQRTFDAEFSAPVYEDADTVSEYKPQTSAKMIYVPSLKSFIVLTDKITVPEINGKAYVSYDSASGLSFVRDYYNVSPDDDAFKGISIEAGLYPKISVDVNSQLFLDDFEAISSGAKFNAKYEDKGVFTETYVLEGETVKRVKALYKPFDYPNGGIRPQPPEEFSVGAKFNIGENTYVIKGYRDINPADESNCRYYSVSDMPDVTKNTIYYVLYERDGYEGLPVYYINIYADGKKIGDFGVKEGEDINIGTLKANFDDKTVVGKLAGYPYSVIDSVISAYSVTWPSGIPSQMPKHDITVTLSVTYSLNRLTAEFVVSDPLQSFVKGEAFTENDGVKTAVASGNPWTYGSTDDDAYYGLPQLNDYFDMAGRKYYSFYGWENQAGERFPYGIRLAFTGNESYKPVFTETNVSLALAFISYGEYGYEYYYKIIEGDYFGETLAEVIAQNGVKDPVRTDINGVYEYKFAGWGVDTAKYVVGSEKDVDGNVKTYLLFKAIFTESYKPHTITFDACGGKFSDGESLLKKVGVFGDDLSGVKADDYSDEKGKFSFICWTTVPYSLAHKVDINDLVVGNADVTYYAYYSLDPATITLTFEGKVDTDPEDGTGNVYFNNDKTKTQLEVSDLYGRSYYLTANTFAVDSLSKTYVPDYLKWTVDGKDYVSAFYNDGYMAEIPFDGNAVVQIVFKEATAKIINVSFVSEGECFEPDGTKIENVVCRGTMRGLRRVENFYEPYGTAIVAPFVDYYSENHHRFDCWKAVLADGSEISVKAGEEIIVKEHVDFYAVYVHDTTEKIKLTFRAEPMSGAVTGELLTGLTVFPDGSVETENYGVYGENVTFDKIPTCKGLKFKGWTTDGNDLITAEELLRLTYSSETKYYAVYSTDEKSFDVTIKAGDGKFGDGSAEMKLPDVAFGTLTKKLENPTPNAGGLIFSHYEDENGYPVTAIEKAITLYAKYAKPISDAEGLKNINFAPEQNYVLTSDIIIDDTGIFDESGLIEWTALGANSKNGFSGTLNGNGYKICISAKSGTSRNFGLFSKISGTVYNLSLVGYFSISGQTDAEYLGAFAGEVTEKGRIIDCSSFTRAEVTVTSSKAIAVSGAIGINRGLVDGFISSATGTVLIDGNEEFNIGAVAGVNRGTMKNVNQGGRAGYFNVSISRSLNCNLGSFVGYNSGLIENSFSERQITINLSQGDNLFVEKSVVTGGFVGRNDGTIKNASALYGKLEFSVNNLSLFEYKGLYLSYDPYDEYPRYIVYEVGKDSQGPTHTTKYVIYLDDDALKTGSTYYKEYTLSEFRTDCPDEAKKIDGLRNAVSFGEFVSENHGDCDNAFVIEKIGTGNGVELVSGCGFDEIKWSYLEKMVDKIYG